MTIRSLIGATVLAGLTATPCLARPALGVWQLPAGLFGQPSEHFNKPFAIDDLTIYQGPRGMIDLTNALAGARKTGTHVILGIGPLPRYAAGPGNRFSLDRWEAAMKFWCHAADNGRSECFDFTPYVNDGTLQGLWIMETPRDDNDPGLRSGSKPGIATIQQMAAFAKSLWPNVKVAVDTVLPCYLTQNGGKGNIDIAMFEISTRNQLSNIEGCNGATYATGAQFVQAQTTMLRQAGIAYTLGMPVVQGAGPSVQHATLQSFKYYAEVAARDSNALGFLAWLYADPSEPTVSNGVWTWPNFWNEGANPGVTAAVREVESCFAGGLCPSAPP